VSMACKKNSRQQIRSPHPLPLRALLLCCNYKACRGGGAVALCAVGWWEKMLFMHNCHVVTSPAMWPKQFLYRSNDMEGNDRGALQVEDEAALKIQRNFRRFCDQQSFKRRSFGKFGTEALDLIRRQAVCPSFHTSTDSKTMFPPRPARTPRLVSRQGSVVCKADLAGLFLARLRWNCRYAEASGQLQEETFASKARLVLHFDVNKTIIMSDKAQVCLSHSSIPFHAK